MGCDGGNCGSSPSVIFGYVGTAILLKFLFGIDDVVWLAPFMAREVSHGRLVIAVKYVLINFTICAIAVALAIIVHTSIHHGARHAEDLADKIIACFASALLLLYAYYIAKQDGVCGELEDGEDPPDKSEYTPLHEIEDEEDPAGPRRRSGTTGLDTRPSDVSDFEDEADDLGCHERLVVGCLSSGLEPSSPGKDEARRRFVIVAVLGNLDDFLMYFSIVVSLHFCWWTSVWKSTTVSGAENFDFNTGGSLYSVRRSARSASRRLSARASGARLD